ncbi:MAG: glycine cleavage system protein GcvH [Candidatus Omnitrophica bacterium]|nr:glycine cleavage system protein GcvH [Candidatus Omnitrophota bacterium]MDD5430530.1 glycine cleavage system protein GcvH [Candidatus Omnitrophota bacterium]
MSIMKFAKSHEWARVDNDTAVIGITDYAQAQLGDIVFIELPKAGDSLKQSSQLGTVESTKAASELYLPLGGKVIEVNEDLINNPQWINESPQERGWMIKIKIENPAELDGLMDEVSYKEFIDKEAHT